MMFRLTNLFLILSVFASLESKALTCNSILSNDTPTTIFFKAGALQSLESFESNLPEFPLVNRNSTHEDILEIIEEFRAFANHVRQNALTLDDLTQNLLFHFAEEVEAEMDRFSIWYNEFRNTWELYKTTSGIVGAASRVKAYYFEAKVGYLLARSGFQSVRNSITLGELRQDFGDEDSLTHEEKKFLADRAITEIDFIASKDGVNYLIELKSYLPIMNKRFFTNMGKTQTQMKKRNEYLKVLGLESTWKTMLIFEYEIDPSVMRQHFDELVDVHFGLMPFTD